MVAPSELQLPGRLLLNAAGYSTGGEGCGKAERCQPLCRTESIWVCFLLGPQNGRFSIGLPFKTSLRILTPC